MANASQKFPPARDPFRAPAVSSAPPEPVVVDDSSPPPRISPMWAILLGSLVPYHAGFWTLLILDGFLQSDAVDEIIGLLSYFVLFSAVEVTAFQARTLWLGPGRFFVRVPVALFSIASVAALPGWVAMLTIYEGIEGEGTLEFAAMRLLGACSALVSGGVVFACGSRDVARSGNRLAFGRADLSAAIFAGALLLFTVIPFAAGAADLSETQLRLLYYDVTRDLFRTLAATVAILFMSTTWRFGVRGIERLFSWKTALFCVAAAPWILLAAGIAFDALVGQGPGPSQPIAAFAALYVVPIGREFFLRWSGYRAINAYAERRRRRKQTTSAAVE